MGQLRSRPHPDTNELIDYLDSSVEPSVAHHLEQCPLCLDGLEQIRQARRALSALPQHVPPQQAWSAIQARLGEPSTSRHRPLEKYRWLSMAASLMLLGFMLFLFTPLDNPGETETPLLLVDETRNLESILGYLRDRERPMNLRAASRIVQIEDSIGAIDMVLGEHAGLAGSATIKQSLIEERVNLLRNLVAARAQPMTVAYRAY